MPFRSTKEMRKQTWVGRWEAEGPEAAETPDRARARAKAKARARKRRKLARGRR